MALDPIQMKMAPIATKCLLRQASAFFVPSKWIQYKGNEKSFTRSMKLTLLFTVELKVDQ